MGPDSTILVKSFSLLLVNACCFTSRIFQCAQQLPFFFCFCVVCWMLRRGAAGRLVKQTTGKIKKKLFTDRSFSGCFVHWIFFLLLQTVLWMFWTKELFFPLTDLSLDLQDKVFFLSYRSFSNGCSGEWKFCSCNRSFSGCSGEKTITKSNSSTFVMSLKISFFNMDVGGDSKWLFFPGRLFGSTQAIQQRDCTARSSDPFLQPTIYTW